MNRISPDVPKSAHEALKADQEGRLPYLRMAAEYDHSKTWVYDVLNGETPFAIHHIEKWAQLTGGEHIMRWLGRVTHHWVAPIPDVMETPEHELPVLLHDFANLIAGVQAALDDGEITQSESDEVWREGELLIAAVYAVMHSIRQRVTRRPLRPRSMAQGEAMGRASGA